jgi:uncharacterized protein YgiM (DUF1202 family)
MLASRDSLLSQRDDQDKSYSVDYEAVNAMVLNELLKEHRQVQEKRRKLEAQDRKMREQEAMIAKQQKQIEALATGLQKVSDRLDVSEPAPQLVVNNR